MNITTDRLRLREWTDNDRQSFADMSADPEVMQFMMPLQREKAFGPWIDDQISHHSGEWFLLFCG